MAPLVEEESATFLIAMATWEGVQSYHQFSPVKRIGGYPWRLRVYKSHSDDDLYVQLICDKSNEAELWQCTVVFKELRVTGITPDGFDVFSSYHLITKSGRSGEFDRHTFNSWDERTREYCVASIDMKDAVSRIEIDLAMSNDGHCWTPRPSVDLFHLRDGILLIGEEKRKFRVNKELLASQSLFFDRLFNGYFMEKNMAEIPIGDIDYEEFSNIIGLLYGEETALLSYENVFRVVELAVRFELKIVEDRAVSLLLSPAFPLRVTRAQKLLVADRHNIVFMRGILLNTDISDYELRELSGSSELEHLSPDTVRTIVRLCSDRFGSPFLLSMIQ